MAWSDVAQRRDAIPPRYGLVRLGLPDHRFAARHRRCGAHLGPEAAAQDFRELGGNGLDPQPDRSVAEAALPDHDHGRVLGQRRHEIADLLVDVSQTGLAAGLEFELFQPQSEVPKDFYAELPIQIRVTGDYHEFGTFASGIASLPRIVTLHDISLSRGTDNMTMNATAKTYRYLDEEEGGVQ